MKIQPRNKALAQASKNGRFSIVGITLPGDIMLYVANVYGWANGHVDERAAGRTDDMLELILQELQSQPPGP
eukprot:6890028-Karenia_brevis.AAC.1